MIFSMKFSRGAVEARQENIINYEKYRTKQNREVFVKSVMALNGDEQKQKEKNSYIFKNYEIYYLLQKLVASFVHVNHSEILTPRTNQKKEV